MTPTLRPVVIRQVRVWLLIPLVCGCAEFSGEEGRFAFTSNLDRGRLTPWQPRYGVLVGSTVDFTGVRRPFYWVGPRDLPTPPGAMPTLSGAGLAAVDAGVDRFVGLALAPGRARLDWLGALPSDGGPAPTDFFGVEVQEADRIELSDPLLLYLALHPTVAAEDGGRWADVGPGATFAPGARLFLETVPRAPDGGALFYSSGMVQASATAPFAIEATASGLVVLASDAGLAGGSTLTVWTDAGITGTLALEAPGRPTITRVSLVQIPLEPGRVMWVLKATAHLADGGTLWEPPFVWQYESPIVEWDGGGVLAPIWPRRDLRVLALDRCGADAGVVARVAVSLGDLDASTSLEFGTPRCYPPPVEPAAEQPRRCGCTAGGDAAALCVGLVLAAFIRRGGPASPDRSRRAAVQQTQRVAGKGERSPRRDAERDHRRH